MNKGVVFFVIFLCAAHASACCLSMLMCVCVCVILELYTIGGNAAGMPCMFPFLYKDQWYSDCTSHDSIGKSLWCAVQTKFQDERWGYCPVTCK